jgi:hypothetical protein
MAEVVREVGARGVPPEKVAKVIAHALTARRPRTRYLVGADARAMVLLRRLLPAGLGVAWFRAPPASSIRGRSSRHLGR